MNKKILLASAAAVVTLATLGVGTINAQSTTMAGTSIVDRIAQKFNLNKDDVQQVFDEHRDEMHETRSANLETKLNSLVSEGKLSEDQKTKLVAKLEERQNNRPNFESLTREQIKEKRETERTEFKNWAKENGIDLQAIGLGMRMKHSIGINK